jgi:DNA-binding transcriptional MerR regulator
VVKKSKNNEQYLKLLSSKEVAKMLGVSPCTLNKWRQQGYGPPFCKLSETKQGQTRYALRHVQEFIIKTLGFRESTSQ